MKNSRVLAGLVLFLGAVATQGNEVLTKWHWRNPLPQGNTYHNLVFANGNFIALGELGTLLTSTDGTNWTTRDSGTTMDLRDCAYGGGEYVVVGDNGTVLTSTNLQSWTPQFASTFYSLNGIAHANGQFVAVGKQSTIVTSADGVLWESQSSGPWELHDIVYAEGLYVAGGGNAANANSASVQVLLVSSNGWSWSIRVLGNSGPFYSIVHGNGTFAATSGYDMWTGTGALWRSDDGLSWEQLLPVVVPLPEPIITFAGNKWFLIARSASPGVIQMADDLTAWETVSTSSEPLVAIASNGTGLVAAQANGSFLQSQTAMVWTNPHPGLGVSYFTALTFLNDQFIGLSAEHWLLSSNGVGWNDIPAPTNTGNLYNLIYAEGLYLAGGESRSVWVSTNLIDWTNPASNFTSYPYISDTRVAYGRGTFVAVASFESSVLTSSDGLNWTLQNLATNEFGSYLNFRDVTFGDGRFVAVGDTVVATSTNGTNWTAGNADFHASKIVFGEGRFVAIAWNLIATSVDGINWSVQLTDTAFPLVDLAYGAGWFVVTTGRYNVGGSAQVKQPQPYWISPDGVAWTRHTFNTTRGMAPIAFGDGVFLAGTGTGGLLSSDPMVTLNLNFSGQPELQISGPRYRQYQIEYSDVFAATNGWLSLGTFTVTNDPALFKDWSVTNATSRFYRAMLLP
jgi:hypothetical protein